jgi:hypothetical protein
VVLVGEFMEVRLKHTLPAAQFLAGGYATVPVGPHLKSLTGVGSGSGMGTLTLKYDPARDEVKIVRLEASVRVRSWLVDERDSASLAGVTARRGIVPNKPGYSE